MDKFYKFKIFVDNVSDATIKLNEKERDSIEVKEGETVKWNVSKEGYLSDLGEVKVESSFSVAIRLAKATAKVKSTYTKIYKEDGRYVSEQIELNNAGRCLPSSEGQEGNVLSVIEGGFINWVKPSGGEPTDLEEKVRHNTQDIADLKDADVGLDERITDLSSELQTKADSSDLATLSETVDLKEDKTVVALKADKSELESLENTLTHDYWTAAEVNNHINASADATIAAVEAEIGNKADKATTLIGYGITDAYTKAEVDSKISSFMNYKGQVQTTNDLPNDAAIGDVYNVKSTGANYCWNGTAWDKLSEDIDLSGLMPREEAYAELALKANTTDVDAALAFKANKAETEQALSLKADKSELPVVPTKVSAFTNDAGYLTEHQSLATLATKAELQAEAERATNAESLKANASDMTAALATKANSADMETALAAKLTKSELIKADGSLYNKVTVGNNFSLLFNENDGGGAQFKSVDKNIQSFAGVNDGDASGVCVQLYSKYIDTNKGARLNVNPTGMFYTKDRANGSFDAGDELATKGELNLKATLEDVNSLSDQLRVLNDRLSEMTKTNKEDITPTAGTAIELNDATKDYTIAADFNKTLDVVAKSVEIKDATITAAEKLPSPKGVAMLIEASEEVAMKNSTVACNLTGSSNIVEVRNCQYITFRDMVFTGRTYNTIMTGQRSPNQPIKSLTIENCEFREFADHVNIWAATFDDNAVVTINNCHFYDSDEQVFALSNEMLAKNVTVNITNCVIDKCETGDEYEGFILCQDYKSQTVAEFEANAMFKNMTINLSNVTLRGVRLTKDNFKMGTGTAGQCLYVYGAKTLFPYDERYFPTVNVM